MFAMAIIAQLHVWVTVGVPMAGRPVHTYVQRLPHTHVCVPACVYACDGVCKRIFVNVSARVFSPNCRPIFTRPSQAHTVSYTALML